MVLICTRHLFRGLFCIARIRLESLSLLDLLASLVAMLGLKS